nr:MAG TPA: hypothetical protein [Caudoviricetes sp.]
MPCFTSFLALVRSCLLTYLHYNRYNLPCQLKNFDIPY